MQTVVQNLMTYALGRRVEYYDMPGIRKIVKNAKPSNFKFSTLVMGIVSSPAFQSSMVETPAPAQVASSK